MNTVEFRAWDIKRKEMIMIDDLYFFEQEGIHEIADGIAKGHHAEYKIMQYTGIRDKNGKKIFLGDIVKCHTELKYIVDWCEEDAMFYYKDPDGFEDEDLRMCAVSFEVIGNIYENQNLTK
ncbi:YopX family protein [Bacillus cereus]|uniref:YopX family protein n=1 Tax=Bacillus cereus TaxID=1396 RepID=UPI0009437616|nr:YopX family protein [Bacillus cereus]